MKDTIARLRELEAAATPGPWSTEFRSVSLDNDCRDVRKLKAETFLGGYVIGPEEAGRGDFLPVDTALIAEMRNALPKLLAVVEAAEYFIEVYEGGGGAFVALEDALETLEQEADALPGDASASPSQLSKKDRE